MFDLLEFIAEREPNKQLDSTYQGYRDKLQAV